MSPTATDKETRRATIESEFNANRDALEKQYIADKEALETSFHSDVQANEQDKIEAFLAEGLNPDGSDPQDRPQGGSILVNPAAPTFDGEEITIVDTVGVVYSGPDGVMTAEDSPYAVAPSETVEVTATADIGYHLGGGPNTWSFENENEE